MLHCFVHLDDKDEILDDDKKRNQSMSHSVFLCDIVFLL